jgi:hypothetical protein
MIVEGHPVQHGLPWPAVGWRISCPYRLAVFKRPQKLSVGALSQLPFLLIDERMPQPLKRSGIHDCSTGSHGRCGISTLVDWPATKARHGQRILDQAGLHVGCMLQPTT